MKSYNIDTYIYVKSSEGHDDRADVVDMIRHIAGVTSANRHPGIKKLVEVSYNPMDVQITDIIHAINNKQYHSAIVGM